MMIAVSAMAASAIVAQTRLSDETAYKIKAEGFSNSQVEPIAQFMTDDLGPRMAASQMKLRSEEMVVAKLKEMGFQNVSEERAAETINFIKFQPTVKPLPYMIVKQV